MTLLAIAATLLGGSIVIVLSYALWLGISRRGLQATATADELPPLLIVAAVYNEAALIERKIENLLALEYPEAKRRIVIVDGGSTDGTLELVRHSGVTLIETRHRNKTAQLLDALRAFPCEPWVLVTDADAQLASDTLLRLFEVAASDASIAVVGTRVRPVSAHPIESLHWRATDWLRSREFDRGSAAIVAAPCYLARREMLAFADDVIADDVFVACSAMFAGKRVGHSDATVLELRSPRTLRALLRHKYRKGDAYLREILRFLPLASKMPLPMRAIFLWRAALLTIVPLLAMLGAIACVLAVATYGAWLFLAAAFLLLLPPARGAALAALLAMVSAAALVTYPFSRQTASFPKILPDEST